MYNAILSKNMQNLKSKLSGLANTAACTHGISNRGDMLQRRVADIGARGACDLLVKYPTR